MPAPPSRSGRFVFMPTIGFPSVGLRFYIATELVQLVADHLNKGIRQRGIGFLTHHESVILAVEKKNIPLVSAVNEPSRNGERWMDRYSIGLDGHDRSKQHLSGIQSRPQSRNQVLPVRMLGGREYGVDSGIDCEHKPDHHC